MVGFEPTFSSAPCWRIARLSYILSAFQSAIRNPQSAIPQSVQGDLNPRIHHGKVAGCQVTSWTHCNQFRRLESNQHPPGFSGLLHL